VILTYFAKGPIAIDSKILHETLQRLVPEREEQIMGHFTQPYYDKGMAEGKAAGMAEGKAEGIAAGKAAGIEAGIAEGEARGRAKLLAHLLQRRFGAIPGSVHQRIFAADAASIETWAGRAFDAPSLESIFASN